MPSCIGASGYTSWTLPAPPGTAATSASTCACVSATIGSIAGVIRVHPAGIDAAGASTTAPSGVTHAASADSTGAVNTLRTSSASPARRNRSIIATTSSECPPSAKKWSARPTRSTPSSACQIPASTCSAPACGAS